MAGKKNKKSKKRSERKQRQRQLPDSSLASNSTAQDDRSTIHFTVASLPSSADAESSAFFNFERELEILKAALLYADRVKLCSVGASFMSGIHELSNLPTERKAEVIKRTLPVVEPNATPEQLDFTQRLAESLKGARESNEANITERQRVLARSYVDKKWAELKGIVNQQFDDVGGNGFRQLLGTSYLELHPFRYLSPEQILNMGMANDFGLPQEWRSDETYREYKSTVMSTVQDGKTFPLFDDLTGDIVNEAVQNGVISPSQAAIARSRHGGLSGDLIQNLPLFEEAGISDILDIREELRDYLDNFRLAVSEFAQCIQAASWEGEFSDEAERIYREQVAPAVRNIEQTIESNPYLKELSRRFAPGATGAATASLGTFVGSGSALWSLTVLALGTTGAGGHALNAVRDQRQNIEGERLYFYYQARQSLARSR